MVDTIRLLACASGKAITLRRAVFSLFPAALSRPGGGSVRQPAPQPPKVLNQSAARRRHVFHWCSVTSLMGAQVTHVSPDDL